MFKSISGTRDILPEEASGWQKIEEISRNLFSLYAYQEIRTPVIEEAGLFTRSLGEFTEIVQKQMFLIKNKEELYALRPEGTAPIVRSYLENNLDKLSGLVKFYYLGPMFRLERPQKGRLRQFHHIGAEVIGSHQPEVDIEVVVLADNLLKAWGISGYKIILNNLGCSKDKKELMNLLRVSLSGKLTKLCADCQARFKHNILRILDCKNAACGEVVKRGGLDDKHLCADCKTHFAKVKAGLNSLKIDYAISPYLVRGLDYYTRTVFEIKHDALGAQDAICAGGRYDNLAKELGGPDVGAIGFAFGVERILLAHSSELVAQRENMSFIIALGENAKIEGMKVLQDLRKNNICADMDYEGKSLKGAMRKANDLNAKFVLIIGENELKNNAVTLKDMASGEQKEIKQSDLIKELTP